MVVGLGNPGPRFARTRHNAGFLVLDAVGRVAGVRFSRVLLRPYARARWGSHHLVKPLTYMNRSGEMLPRLLRRTGCGPEDLLVVYDNVDLPPGTFRFKRRGEGGGGHRGMESIQRALGTSDFRRVAVGVGRPSVGGKLAEYVLSEPGPEERVLFLQGVELAAQAVLEALGAEGAVG